jgi:hypothetical protein
MQPLYVGRPSPHPHQRFWAPEDPPPDGRRVAPPEGFELPPDGRDGLTDERGAAPEDRELPTEDGREGLLEGLRRTDEEPTDLVEPAEGALLRGALEAEGARTPEELVPDLIGAWRNVVDELVGGTITGLELEPTTPDEVRGTAGCRCVAPREMPGEDDAAGASLYMVGR